MSIGRCGNVVAGGLIFYKEKELFISSFIFILMAFNFCLNILTSLQSHLGTEENPINLVPVPPSVYNSMSNRVERASVDLEDGNNGVDGVDGGSGGGGSGGGGSSEYLQDVSANVIRLIGENGLFRDI